MAITLPNDIRPVIKSYSGKKLSEAFMEHQNVLRERFNKQNNEILKKRELKKKSSAESGNYYYYHYNYLLLLLWIMYIIFLYDVN